MGEFRGRGKIGLLERRQGANCKCSGQKWGKGVQCSAVPETPMAADMGQCNLKRCRQFLSADFGHSSSILDSFGSQSRLAIVARQLATLLVVRNRGKGSENRSGSNDVDPVRSTPPPSLQLLQLQAGGYRLLPRRSGGIAIGDPLD